MTQDFVHLRMHTEFSIKDGMLNPKKVVHKAIASGMKALAITDATAMFGDVIFYKAASAAGIKPILGADCSITNHYNRDDYLRLLFLARNHQAYGKNAAQTQWEPRKYDKGVCALWQIILR